MTNRAMGCEQLVKLSRVAGEAGDNLPGDEGSRRDINEELEYASDDNAGCRTVIGNGDFIDARRAWP